MKPKAFLPPSNPAARPSAVPASPCSGDLTRGLTIPCRVPMKQFMILFLLLLVLPALARRPSKLPRVLISTDIGGTDPDDNQSMMHFLLYSNMVDCEGLVSSPSYGDGSKEEILRMIGLYEKDLPRLRKHAKGWPKPAFLRSVTKQGRHGAAPMCGYQSATEGSDWIVTCARRKDPRPLYVLVWGGLDDLAQALHDAPDIAPNIRVYWIGGPNKKWGLNAYAYIVENFPSLWFIEDNSSYRGFIADYKKKAPYHALFYDTFVKGRGFLGRDFYNYKQGQPKLGDTPSLLYMLHGNPADPGGESWGGSFEKAGWSSRVVLTRQAVATDTVPHDGILELRLDGPVRPGSFVGRPGLKMTVDGQQWDGYYLGEGRYMVRYSTYKTGLRTYFLTFDSLASDTLRGAFFVDKVFPGRRRAGDYEVGPNWYVDREAPSLYQGGWQGAVTVGRWRDEAMQDWARRCQWLLP